MSHVAFEVDHVDAPSGTAWSVKVKGMAHEMTETVDSCSQRARECAVASMGLGRRDHLRLICPDQVSGRRFEIQVSGQLKESGGAS